jgi:PIN domain nuclease of toxin-antitoxin system
VRLLLDTMALIFSVEAPDRLGKRAFAALKRPDNVRQLSSVSLSEIAIKATLGKLDFSAESARRALDDMDVDILPFTAGHAFRLLDLPPHHRDPFDRQIIAQAFSEGIPIVTCDEQFSAYDGLEIIW